MGKYIGYHPFLGTVGNLTYARGENHEVIVKLRSSMNKERIMTDPAFVRVRETMAEFRRAAKASKFFLETFRVVVLNKPDRKISSRLIKEFMAVIASDQSHQAGSRTPEAGDLTLLTEFDFNRKASIGTSFWGDYTPTIDRVTGHCDIAIAPYIPNTIVQMPEEATHYRFVVGGIELDLEGHTYVRQAANSAYLGKSATLTAPLTVAATVTPNSTLPLFLVFGIEYFVEKNGTKLPLNNGAFNAIRIAKVDA
jgi:hypothetical protein